MEEISPIFERTSKRRMVEVEQVTNVIYQVTQPDFSGVNGANISVNAEFDVLGGGFWSLD